jgi:hypothetical protein
MHMPKNGLHLPQQSVTDKPFQRFKIVQSIIRPQLVGLLVLGVFKFDTYAAIHPKNGYFQGGVMNRSNYSHGAGWVGYPG